MGVSEILDINYSNLVEDDQMVLYCHLKTQLIEL